MIFREYQKNEDIINFYSCGKAPYYKLSNFALISDGIIFDGLTFHSTEHAFQAQKYIKEQRPRFSVNGDLGNINNVNNCFELIFENNWEKKKKYWMKKNNIGIIAKMATNIKIGKRLGLIRDIHFMSTHNLWMELLALKFNIDEFKIILQSIKNKYLLEFDRGAKRLCLKNIIPIWGALVDNGTMYGNNLMGKYLMLLKET
jgi:predicted NAD-dependent protein-ADP-ribosyltransferase YbiA (DUF1768 family)